MGTATLTISHGKIWWQRLRRFAGWLRTSARARVSRRALALEQTLTIGKGTVSLVSVDGERVLVGITQGSISFHAIGACSGVTSAGMRKTSEGQ